MSRKRILSRVVYWIFLLLLIVGIFYGTNWLINRQNVELPEAPQYLDIESIPDWDGETYSIEINNNIPFFSSDEITKESFEEYGELDALGRTTVCRASIGIELMPTEEREAIDSVLPSGWVSPMPRYDFIDGEFLYNRCHVIGFQLTGENDNVQNLITGTRSFNINGMLPYENQVASYIRRTDNHVMYRVTPDFRGREPLARGVLIEAYSVEDMGQGICFNVYCYNAEPGVEIDYQTGESSPRCWLSEDTN